MSKQDQEILRIARDVFDQRPSWVTFFREVLGVDGIVRQTYQTAESLAKFEQSDVYPEIQSMLADLRHDDSQSGTENEPTRAITVRLPKSLHESLRAEAHDHRTSLNKLCVAKLLQAIDAELVPVEAGTAENSRALSIFFDLSEFGAVDIAEVLSMLSEIYHELGGDALIIDGIGMVDSAMVPEPAGG